MAEAFLLSLVLGFLGFIWRKLSFYGSTSTVTIEEVLQLPDPVVLYLRSFDDDQQGFERSASFSTAGELVFSTYDGSYEEKIINPFSSHCRVIAISKPDQQVRIRGASRINLPTDHWQEELSKLAKKADVILLRPAHSPGLAWELEHIVHAGFVPKLILSTLVGNAEEMTVRIARYYHFAKVFEAQCGIQLPPFSTDEAYIAFSLSGEPFALRHARDVKSFLVQRDLIRTKNASSPVLDQEYPHK